jgi:hypothetical protein
MKILLRDIYAKACMEDFNTNIGNESFMVKKMVSWLANIDTSKDLSVKCMKLFGRVRWEDAQSDYQILIDKETTF